MLLGSIFIVHKRLEDVNNKNKDLKTKIYHIVLKTMLQYSHPSLFFVKLRKSDTNNITVLLKYKNSIELVCVDSYK